MEELVKLKPCPFCGGEAEIYKKLDNYFPDRYYPRCLTQHCIGRNRTTYYRTEEAAIKAWNKRDTGAKELINPFANDPFAIVYKAFQNLYPDKKCVIYWEPREIKDEEGNGYVGMTHFANDGDITVEISVNMFIGDAVETLAHELAHVAVGASEEHGEEWEKAFDAIHEEFDRIGIEMFGEDSGTAIEVSDGKGGVDPSRLKNTNE